MNWFASVDIYCERLSPAYWAEPVNALSNIAFVLAAIWAGFSAKSRGITSPAIWVLIPWAALIGVGSYLFHTHANRWSEMADVIPIWGFVAAYVLISVNRLGGVQPGKLAKIVAIGAICGFITSVFFAIGEGDTTTLAHDYTHSVDPLNGSGQYAPALIALLVLSFVMWRRKHPQRGWALGAVAVFFTSLLARTVDMSLCEAIPGGTHFMWHILNGLMVGLLLQLLIRATPAKQRI
ncbi:ceramidase domain-containing protein [Aestuariibius sp. HNIBRBA575]|uniref:ceramidase domain-containing protein n=1 Tax=Aestuariibius sp. HNIBRBA575 TaxID=3233343 RepID=UPI0034A0DDD2